MRNVTMLTLIGVVLGIVLASLIVPPALSWYATPGGLLKGAQIQSLVQIPDVIRYATNRLLVGQLAGALLGGLSFMAFGLMRKSRSRREAATAPAPPGAP